MNRQSQRPRSFCGFLLYSFLTMMKSHFYPLCCCVSRGCLVFETIGVRVWTWVCGLVLGTFLGMRALAQDLELAQAGGAKTVGAREHNRLARNIFNKTKREDLRTRLSGRSFPHITLTLVSLVRLMTLETPRGTAQQLHWKGQLNKWNELLLFFFLLF